MRETNDVIGRRIVTRRVTRKSRLFRALSRAVCSHSPFLLCHSRFTKPQTFADCIGNELPLGWEEAYDKHVGAYYINHVNRKSFSIPLLLSDRESARRVTGLNRSSADERFNPGFHVTCPRASRAASARLLDGD